VTAPGRAAADSTPGSEAEPVLRVEDLVVEFRKDRSHKLRAVDGVSLAVGAGEIVGVVGESGSGKSTLGRAVAGFERPTSGRVLLPDTHGGLSARDSVYGHRDVQMIFQDSASALNPRASVARILAQALAPRPPLLGHRRPAREQLAEQVRAALRGVDLPEAYATRRSQELSGGEKQRVAIARALAAQPALIVCDEAVSGLDVAVRAITLNLLARLRAQTNVALLFISHDISVVAHLADRVVVMYHGKVVESGTVNDVLDKPADEYTQRLIGSVPKLELGS
jgi:ABC-type glutathione transport system ATPase component